MNQPDGMVIIDATTEPLFAAARLLLSRGITGKLQIWDKERPFCRMQGDIERMARLTVAEDQHGLCLRRYVERVTDGGFEDEGDDMPAILIGRPEGAPQASRAIGSEAT